jgi:hypothetical protein
MLWKRFRRRSLAPRRPAVFPEQWGLVLVTVLALLIGLAVVVYALVS